MLDNFREWLSDNLRYILLVMAALLIIVVGICIFRLIGGASSKKDKDDGKKTVTQVEESTESSDPVSLVMGVPQLASTDLVRDDPAILELVTTYYNAAASKDIATLSTIVDPWSTEVENSILSNDLIESYENISTYSKAGPVDNSYVVYAYYEGRISGIATAAPGLSLLYIETDDEGHLIIKDRSSSKEVSDFINTVSSDDDVQELIADVNRMCESAKNSDPALKAFMDGLTDESSSGKTETADAGEASPTSAKAVSDVNVRSEPSTNGSILTVLLSGHEVTVVEKLEGWSHVNFTDSYTGYDVDGYVSNNYLEFSTESTGTAAGSDSTV